MDDAITEEWLMSKGFVFDAECRTWTFRTSSHFLCWWSGGGFWRIEDHDAYVQIPVKTRQDVSDLLRILGEGE